MNPIIRPPCLPPTVGIKNKVLKWQQLAKSVGGQTCWKAPANKQSLEVGPTGTATTNGDKA